MGELLKPILPNLPKKISSPSQLKILAIPLNRLIILYSTTYILCSILPLTTQHYKS
jgi:hypothetical protein